MVIAELQVGSLVFLDTAPLIYFIEGNSPYQQSLQALFRSNAAREFMFLTSSITLLEVLVKPLRMGNRAIAQQYRDILTQSASLQIIDVTTPIAERAAALRAQYSLRTPDAIQVASAMEYGADYFLTNGLALKKVSGIPVITLSELS